MLKRACIAMAMMMAGLAAFPQYRPPKKQVAPLRIDTVIEVDGYLDEPIWQKAPVATDFTTQSPTTGDTAWPQTTVRIMYDDDALYFGAFMYDHPDSISMGLAKRDQLVVFADNFYVCLNPFNDGRNYYEFDVSTTNVQVDIKKFPSSDFSWNPVWDTETRVTDTGWVAEVKIPFKTMLFPKDSVQTWSMNLWRIDRIRHTNSTWNLVDRNKMGRPEQQGLLVGLRNIREPFRLRLFPYVSGTLDKRTGVSPGYGYNAGLDMEYGLSANFSLHTTLVPDFGQTFSDDKVLNVSPFEVKYTEKRQFFLQNMDLFNRSGLLYTRRIAGEPEGYSTIGDDLPEDHYVSRNPIRGNLLNATKITGRNSNGWGLGFLNAIEGNSYGQITDGQGNERELLTESWKNYNIIAVDKTFAKRKNTYVNFVNLNTLEPDSQYTANVSGLDFMVNDEKDIYRFEGRGAYSMQDDRKNKTNKSGYLYRGRVGKFFGNWVYHYAYHVESDTYDPNDMGFLARSNKVHNSLVLKYQIIEPTDYFINGYTQMHFAYNELFKPEVYGFTDPFQQTYLKSVSSLTFKNWMRTQMNLNYWIDSWDYWEPRVDGMRFRVPQTKDVYLYYYSNTQKKYYVSLGGAYAYAPLVKNSEQPNDWYYNYYANNRYRLNTRYQLNYNFKYQYWNHTRYLNKTADQDSVIFGRRDRIVVTNTVSMEYIFNNKSYITFRLRHYWSRLNYSKYDDYYFLDGQEGTLHSMDTDARQHYGNLLSEPDRNYNIFNIDILYSWNFAPASFLTVALKNSITSDEGQILYDYTTDLRETLMADQINAVNVKLTYYIDADNVVQLF